MTLMLKKILLALILLIGLGFVALSFIKIPAPDTEVTKEIPVKLS
jgi:hypothetical protein